MNMKRKENSNIIQAKGQTYIETEKQNNELYYTRDKHTAVNAS